MMMIEIHKEEREVIHIKIEDIEEKEVKVEIEGTITMEVRRPPEGSQSARVFCRCLPDPGTSKAD